MPLRTAPGLARNHQHGSLPRDGSHCLHRQLLAFERVHSSDNDNERALGGDPESAANHSLANSARRGKEFCVNPGRNHPYLARGGTYAVE